MTAPVTDPAAEMYARQQIAVLHAVQEAQAAWARLDPYDLDGSWENDVRPRAVIAVEEAQIEAAAPAGLYVAAAVLAAGALSTPVARVVAGAFAGFGSNGLPLAALLDYVLAYLRRALALGMAPSEARALGLSRLLTYVSTEIGDTGRAATQAAMIADTAVAGYERVVRLPACGRCVILAGRLYRYSEGFLRHPRCDCQMRPVTYQQWHSTNLTNTPAALFEQMSRTQQDKAFGQGDAEAIRAGADMARVVNSRRKGAVYVAGGTELTREATTVRGVGRQLGELAIRGGRYRSTGVKRPTAAQLVIASTDRDELIDLLGRYGYLRVG